MLWEKYKMLVTNILSFDEGLNTMDFFFFVKGFTGKGWYTQFQLKKKLFRLL